MIVYKERTNRSFPKPVVFEEFPNLDKLRNNLAWIMRNKTGTYVMTADALEWYEAWYAEWKTSLDAEENYSERVAEFRFDVNMLRLALLISMSRYDDDMQITKQDLLEAADILKGTFKGTVKANVEAGIALNEFNGHYGRVIDFIKKMGTTDRKQLTRNMSSKGIGMQIVKDVLGQLLTEGRISVRDGTMPIKDRIGWTKTEIYSWAEGD